MNIEIINQTYIRILTYDWLSELMNEKSKTINNKKYLSTLKWMDLLPTRSRSNIRP